MPEQIVNSRLNKAAQKKRLKASISQAGPRYSPELHVALALIDDFHALGHTKKFYEKFVEKIFELINALERVDPNELRAITGIDSPSSFTDVSEQLYNVASGIVPKIGSNRENLPVSHIKKIVASVLHETRPLEEQLLHSEDLRDYAIRSNISSLRGVFTAALRLQEYLEGRTIAASQNRYILLNGEAGSGKTHFLCDLVTDRIENGYPSLLFMGHEFGDENPWRTILKLTQFEGSKEEFLDGLERYALARKSRYFLVIDALNEGATSVDWNRLINDVEKYPSICIVVSVRSGFENHLLSKNLKRKLHLVSHIGFAEIGWNAFNKFFEYYKIEPNIPMFYNEFSNPLFLKIFCEAYKSQPSAFSLGGHYGFTHVFEQYIKHQGKKALKHMGIKNADPKSSVWDATIKNIAQEMAKSGKDRISYKKASRIAAQVFAERTDEYLHTLERFNLLLKQPVYTTKTPYKISGYEYKFPYQKFSDHLIARYLFSKFKKDTVDDGALRNLLGPYLMNPGLVEAFSIQIPERFEGRELINILDQSLRTNWIVKSAFLQSLVSRDMKEQDGELQYFKKQAVLKIIADKQVGFPASDVFATALVVCAAPRHPLNADFLYQVLMPMPMAKRDRCWTIFINNNFEHGTEVERIISWSLGADIEKHAEESIFQVSIVLAWFLCSSNRGLRDRATKALVRMLRERLNVLIALLKKFADVNDMYVYERLMAVAAGCSLYGAEDFSEELALYIYNANFIDKEPPVDVLARDYARGAIEAVVMRNKKLARQIDLSKIRPPYNSAWPKKFPSLRHIERSYPRTPSPSKDGDYRTLWSSIMYHNHSSIVADFGKYTLGGAVQRWSNYRLTDDGSTPGLSVSPALDKIERWLFKRVVDLGWHPALFYTYDSSVRSDSKYGGRKERIGKKYQWIAYHEVLARLADNYAMKDILSSSARVYDGPWQCSVRDIDPSHILSTVESEAKAKFSRMRRKYSGWMISKTPKEWTKKDNVSEMVKKILRPSSRSKWIYLTGYWQWDEPKVTSAPDQFRVQRRHLWILVQSVIVRKKDMGKIVECAKVGNRLFDSSIESHSLYSLHLREFPRSFAYESLFWNGRSRWMPLRLLDEKESVCYVQIPVEEYIDERSSRNYSILDHVNLSLPSREIMTGMGLRLAQEPYKIVDRDANLIAWDPSFEWGGDSCLLINRCRFASWLDSKDFCLVIQVIGEKSVQNDNQSVPFVEFGGLFSLDSLGSIEVLTTYFDA